MTRQITPSQADVAYTILIQHAGVIDAPWHRESFIYHTSQSPRPTTEYRFCGTLGFGGKFRNNGNKNNVPHVDCYREDLTQEREAVIAATNAALAELFGMVE